MKHFANLQEFWQDWKEFKRTCHTLNEEKLQQTIQDYVDILPIFYFKEDAIAKHEQEMRNEAYRVYRQSRLMANGWYINNTQLTVRKNDNKDDIPKILYDITDYIFNSETIMNRHLSEVGFAEKFDEYVVNTVANAFGEDIETVRTIWACQVQIYLARFVEDDTPSQTIDIDPAEKAVILDFLSNRTLDQSFNLLVQNNQSILQLGIPLDTIKAVFLEERKRYLDERKDNSKVGSWV